MTDKYCVPCNGRIDLVKHDVVSCRECGIPYHKSCFDEHPLCSKPDCVSTQYDVQFLNGKKVDPGREYSSLPSLHSRLSIPYRPARSDLSLNRWPMSVITRSDSSLVSSEDGERVSALVLRAKDQLLHRRYEDEARKVIDDVVLSIERNASGGPSSQSGPYSPLVQQVVSDFARRYSYLEEVFDREVNRPQWWSGVRKAFTTSLECLGYSLAAFGALGAGLAAWTGADSYGPSTFQSLYLFTSWIGSGVALKWTGEFIERASDDPSSTYRQHLLDQKVRLRKEAIASLVDLGPHVNLLK